MDHDIQRREWGDRTDTHTQPMLANYLVGAALWAGGYDPHGWMMRSPSRLPPNPKNTRQPFDRTIVDLIRQPFVAFGAGTVMMLYLLGRRLNGPGRRTGCGRRGAGQPAGPGNP